MKTDHDFGLLIAYILPGFLAIIGFSNHSRVLQTWILGSTSDAPSVGGFLYLTIASIFVGLTLSTIRWAVLDSIHSATGLRDTNWNFRNLADREQGFGVLIDVHYRYYQFYGNSLFALMIFCVSRWSSIGVNGWEAVLALALGALFLAGSRDTLRKYQFRAKQLLATSR